MTLPNYYPDRYKKLNGLYQDPWYGELPAEELKNYDKILRRNINQNKLLEIYKNGTEKELIAVSRNPSLPSTIIEELSDSNNLRILTGIAANPNSNEKVLQKILNRMDNENIFSTNPASEDWDWSQRLRNTLFYHLINTTDKLNYSIRKSVEETGQVDWTTSPVTLRSNLFDDETCEIFLLSKEPSDLRILLMSKKDISVSVIEKILETKHYEVLKELSRQKNVTPEILEKLSRRNLSNVDRVIAKNPLTPHKVLLKLSLKKSNYIKSSLLRNPNITEEMVLNILRSDTTVQRYKEMGLKKLKELNPEYNTIVDEWVKSMFNME